MPNISQQNKNKNFIQINIETALTNKSKKKSIKSVQIYNARPNSLHLNFK